MSPKELTGDADIVTAADVATVASMIHTAPIVSARNTKPPTSSSPYPTLLSSKLGVQAKIVPASPVLPVNDDRKWCAENIGETSPSTSPLAPFLTSRLRRKWAASPILPNDPVWDEVCLSTTKALPKTPSGLPSGLPSYLEWVAPVASPNNSEKQTRQRISQLSQAIARQRGVVACFPCFRC